MKPARWEIFAFKYAIKASAAAAEEEEDVPAEADGRGVPAAPPARSSGDPAVAAGVAVRAVDAPGLS